MSSYAEQVSSYEQQLSTMNDIDEALKSAIAHSGAGEQRERWEQLRTELADERVNMAAQAKRRAEREEQFQQLAALYEPEPEQNPAPSGTAAEVVTEPNSHPEDGGPREIAFEKPAEE